MRFFLIAALALLFCCRNQRPPSHELLSQQEINKLDIHTHYRYARDFLPPLLEEWKMRTMLVDVWKTDSLGHHRYWEEILTHREKHPERFFLCSAFNAAGIDDPDFAENTIARLKGEIAAGAQMVKVWKNIGMVDKDTAGNFVQIDDLRFQPIWDFLSREGIPVMAHIGEPLQAWRPLEEGNPHYNYYKNHPEYHAYLHPEIPRWETIMEARDNWLARNPDLTVIGAHMGSMSHDVDLIAQRLDRYPNLYVEPAARFGDLTRQESGKVRAFYLKYQDRILYGTDLGTSAPAGERSPEELEGEYQRIKKMFELHWAYFSGTDSLYYDSPMISFPVNTHGLALPDSVLRKVYAWNAERILGLAAQ